MNFKIYHPFETVILKGLRDNVNIESFAVNSGKVFNFYNPLNFRNVKCDLGGKSLPKLPFPVIPNEKNSPYKTVFDIGEDYYKIDIYLFCNFYPPLKWVPGPTFIPFINEAWIVSKVYLDETDPKIFKIIGSTKNSNTPGTEGFNGEVNSESSQGATGASAPQSLIKYESFNINRQDEAGNDIEYNEETDYLFEETINWNGNAFCYSPIASLKKDENDEWQVTQFLKDNLPITSFFDSAQFELNNTEMYDLNIKEKLPSSETLSDEQKEEKKAKIEEQNKSIYVKTIVSEYFSRPNTDEVKGYIRSYLGYFATSSRITQLKLDESPKGLEILTLDLATRFPSL